MKQSTEFLTRDLPKAELEAQAFADCMLMASYHGYQKDYNQIANYLESAARSARALSELKENKKIIDEARSLLDRIEQEDFRRLYL